MRATEELQAENARLREEVAYLRGLLAASVMPAKPITIPAQQFAPGTATTFTVPIAPCDNCQRSTSGCCAKHSMVYVYQVP